MNELAFFRAVLYAFFGFAALVFPLLFFVAAPYGRHVRGGWGPTVHRTLGWVVMESPTLIVFTTCFVIGGRFDSVTAWVFLGMWWLHYGNRVLVYPFRLRGGQLRMPLSVVAMALLFNLVNGYLQGRYLNSIAPPYPARWLADPRFVVGVALFVGGLAINLHSDAVLRALRQPGETGYKIPVGGLYRLVSCPNYLGELVEWCGWALATWSLSGLAFAWWTAANLVPRAWAHHRWYRRTFLEYPKERRAVIPLLF